MDSITDNKNQAENGNGALISKSVRIWLLIGVIMVFVQVVIGGITRLTDSGLSITEWEVVKGIFPPMGQEAWEVAFEKYKVAAKTQYEAIHADMSLSEFKFIYFWEWFHRLWARSMGFVFLIPFLVFVYKKMIPKRLMMDLGIVILLAILVASLGWIMVKSGFFQRPWVNAYKLTIHLSFALILYGYLLWTTFRAFQSQKSVFHNRMLRNLGITFTAVLAIQIFIGGIVSGMKAGLAYPSWPDMNGNMIPAILLDSAQWKGENFVNYEQTSFMPALIQFVHRNVAYLLTIIGLYYIVKCHRSVKFPLVKRGAGLLLVVLITQVLLGIFTVINCKGSIPITLGVLHQAGALLLLTVALFLNYQMSRIYK